MPDTFNSPQTFFFTLLQFSLSPRDEGEPDPGLAHVPHHPRDEGDVGVEEVPADEEDAADDADGADAPQAVGHQAEHGREEDLRRRVRRHHEAVLLEGHLGVELKQKQWVHLGFCNL